MCLGPGPMPNGAEIARSTIQEVRKVVLRPCGAGRRPHSFARRADALLVTCDRCEHVYDLQHGWCPRQELEGQPRQHRPQALGAAKRHCVPCVELYVFLPCAVLIHCAEVSKPHNCSHLPQVPPASMAIMFSPCRLMNQKQVRSFHSVYQMPRIHRATGPFMRATRAFFLV
jgi:hypothetical protein